MKIVRASSDPIIELLMFLLATINYSIWNLFGRVHEISTLVMENSFPSHKRLFVRIHKLKGRFLLTSLSFWEAHHVP